MSRLQAAWRNRGQWHLVLDFLKQQAGERVDLERAVFQSHCNHPNVVPYSTQWWDAGLRESSNIITVLSVRLE